MRDDGDDETPPPVDGETVPLDEAAEREALARYLPPGRTGRTGG